MRCACLAGQQGQHPAALCVRLRAGQSGAALGGGRRKRRCRERRRQHAAGAGHVRGPLGSVALSTLLGAHCTELRCLFAERWQHGSAQLVPRGLLGPPQGHCPWTPWSASRKNERPAAPNRCVARLPLLLPSAAPQSSCICTASSPSATRLMPGSTSVASHVRRRSELQCEAISWPASCYVGTCKASNA